MEKKKSETKMPADSDFTMDDIARRFLSTPPRPDRKTPAPKKKPTRKQKWSRYGRRKEPGCNRGLFLGEMKTLP